MSVLRVGTRGSALALWQTRWVCARLRSAHPEVEIEEVVIRTHGDVVVDQPIDEDWPVGGFVGAIEQAVLAGRVDFAVHSLKDLPTLDTDGLVVAAVPVREEVHDCLVTREPVSLDDVPRDMLIGTSSPRRAAQMRRFLGVKVAAIRGNVPTRVDKVEAGEFDGVVLAAAGMRRLGLKPAHVVALPVDRFVPAPGQGALAVQTRAGSSVGEMMDVLEDRASRQRVTAERTFLRAVGAGCQTPAGAVATMAGGEARLSGQLFGSVDGLRMVMGEVSGVDAVKVGTALAGQLVRGLDEAS